MSDDFQVSLRHHGEAGVRLRERTTGAAPQALAELLYGSDRYPVPPEGLLIGRDARCQVRLMSGLLAPEHARIEHKAGRFQITDLGSHTGTYLNGEHFKAASRTLRGGDSIAIGDAVLHFLTTQDTPLPPVEIPLPYSQLRMDRPQLRLGCDPSNDIVLAHPRISPVHAEIVSGRTGTRIKDLSRGGDGVCVNGRAITRGFINTGDEIAIGPYRFVFDGELLQQRSSDAGMRLTAEYVSFVVGKEGRQRTILQPTSLTLHPSELLAVIGPSGAGKTTLLKVLCGVQRSASGRVLVDGEPVHARAGDIGYVPQDEIVHSLLTVREAMDFAAELRLPQDLPPDERRAAVDRVLEEVELSAHEQTRVGSLSGGQRKRAGVATELISQPGLLFLDEPTTGLDPGLEQRMMRLFRRLADGGRSTMVVTHATRSLGLCDKVAVMGEGGWLCFHGTPDEALEFFSVEHFDDLYTMLAKEGAETCWARFAQTRRSQAEPLRVQIARRRLVPSRLLWPQALVLVSRRLRILSRDTRNLLILGLQVPILAILLTLLFHQRVFQPGIANYSNMSASLLFLLATVALWFGTLTAAREIVRERSVTRRELAVGVRIPAYLLSKGVVLGLLTAVQTVAFALIVFTLRPLHAPRADELIELAILILASWTGVGMGLVVSVFVDSEDQATSFVPLLLIPQLLFGGSVMQVHQMGVVLKVLSKVVVSQWVFAGLGNGIGMNTRLREDPLYQANPTLNHFGAFFSLPYELAMIGLAAFVAIAGALVWQRLERLRESA